MVIFRLEHVLSSQVNVGFSDSETGFSALDRGDMIFTVKLDEQLALLDPVAFLDQEPSDLGADIRRDIDLGDRLDLARGVARKSWLGCFRHFEIRGQGRQVSTISSKEFEDRSTNIVLRNGAFFSKKG